VPELALQNALLRQSEISMALEKIATDLTQVSDWLAKYHAYRERTPSPSSPAVEVVPADLAGAPKRQPVTSVLVDMALA
jgi:hypothetical protein